MKVDEISIKRDAEDWGIEIKDIYKFMKFRNKYYLAWYYVVYMIVVLGVVVWTLNTFT